MRLSAILLSTIVLSLALVRGWASDGIEGSKHDFSNEKWTGGDACIACHTPESEQPAATAPLWDPSADLNRTFGTPLATSKKAGLGTVTCLRCHDGTIARDTLSAATKDRFINKENPGLFSTGHGSSDHPVGVEYPKFARDFQPAPSVVAAGTVVLPDGRVECISCHDPHGMSGEKKFLVQSNARSALCLTCHRK